MSAALRILWKIVRVYLMAVGTLTTVGVAAIWLTTPRHAAAKPAMARVQIERICSLLDLYRLDNGHFPTTEQGLEALVQRPSVDPIPTHYMVGGYARERDLINPWGNPLSYALDHDRPLLRSIGAPDGKPIEGCWR